MIYALSYPGNQLNDRDSLAGLNVLKKLLRYMTRYYIDKDDEK
jgi:hypothetical protein